MSENINFSDNLTFTKVTSTDAREVTFDITETEGLIISAPSAGTNPTLTVGGDLDITGDLNVSGNTVVNEDTKLSITDKNILMNVPQEPMAPSGTSTIIGGVVTSATVNNLGVSFTANEVVSVLFTNPSSGTLATGTVQANDQGTVSEGTSVNITDGGSGYVVSPDFSFGSPSVTPAGNKPVRPNVLAEGSGTIVIRDWSDGTEPHAGIIWNENDSAWDLNSPIAQDIYEDSPSGTPNTFASNPRIINVGEATDDGDAVNFGQVRALTLDDLSDVSSASASTGQILKYTSDSAWEAGNLSITDLDGIVTPSTSSGYFFWDNLANSGAGAFVFVEEISSTDIDGLALVATDGTLNSLVDVNATPTEGQILAWDADAISASEGAWVAVERVSAGDLDAIQSPSVAPTSSVSTSGTNVEIVAQGQLTSNTEGVTSINAEDDISLTTESTLNLSSLNPITIETGDGTVNKGELTSQGDLFLTSVTSDVYIQNVAYPSSDNTTENLSLLFYNSTLGAMEWGTLPTSSVQSRIQNQIETTFVATDEENDTVVLQAPDVGSPSDVGGNVTNDVGVIIDAGNGRDVLFPGSLVSHIYSDTGLLITATVGDIDITPNGVLRLDGYIFPTDDVTRNEGDVLILDPSDTNKKQLLFSSLSIELLSETSITGGLSEGQVLIADANGVLVNRTLSYSDIDTSTVPEFTTSLLALTDTFDPTDSVLSLTEELKNKYLRWNEQGTQVVYEDTINAANINFVGVETNIEPSLTETVDIGSESKVYKNIYAQEIIAETLTGEYTIPEETISLDMLTADLQNTLNNLQDIGDVFTDQDQTFTGINTFSPVSASGEFSVTTQEGNIDLSSTDGDVNITSVNGQVNINGYSKAIMVEIDYTLISSGTGNLIINIGDQLLDGSVITACRVNVSSAFNGIDPPTLSVGTLDDPSSIMEADEINLSTINLSRVDSFYETSTVANRKQLTATLDLNGATTGVAKILIEYYVI